MQLLVGPAIAAESSYVMINVKNMRNQPVEGAYISIKNGNNVVKKGQTDIYGNFYTEIKDGVITFRASSTGYKDTILTQTIEKDSIIVLIMEEPLGFYMLLFFAVLSICVIYATIRYIRRDGKKSG